MDELTIIYLLTFVIVILLPLITVLIKDGANLYRSVRTALEDDKLTNEEIDEILAKTGVMLRSIVRLIEAMYLKFK